MAAGFTVEIEQADRPIRVAMGQTILEAALAQGVAYPHGCRSGNCGACKSRLIAGEVDLAPYSDFALGAAERADGLILACRAVPWSDSRIAWLGEDDLIVHPRRHLDCRVVRLDDLTHDIKGVTLEVRAGGPFVFSAGQYAAVRFGDLPARDYSMASTPDEDVLVFHIRHVAGGGASAHVANALRVGDPVSLEGPYGTAYLREGHRGPILAVAGGSGLAPIQSIVETALARGMTQPIAVYLGVRDERDLYHEARFAALAARHGTVRFTPVLSDAAMPTARRMGYVPDAVAADLANLDGFKVYTAGPPVMVDAVRRMVLARGVREADIHADSFFTEAEKAKLGDAA